MNIEAIIQGNTDAIIGLTEAILKLTLSLDRKNTPSVIKEVEVPKKEIINSPSVTEAKSPDLDYPTVKELISSLALNHRDEIKLLNTKYDLAVFADILKDKSDITKGVRDPEILRQYYEDLQKIEALIKGE